MGNISSRKKRNFCDASDDPAEEEDLKPFKKNEKKIEVKPKKKEEQSGNMKDLMELFEKYKKAGDDDEEEYEDDDEGEYIKGEGVFDMCEDIKVNPESVLVLLMFFKLEVEKTYMIEKKEFARFGTTYGWYTVPQIKNGVKTFMRVMTDSSEYKNFYRYCFDYLKKGGSRQLDNEMACGTWRVILGEKYGKVDQWIDFMENVFNRPVTRDLWVCFHDFITVVGDDLARFDPVDGAWNSTIDEYVQHLRKLEEEKKKT